MRGTEWTFAALLAYPAAGRFLHRHHSGVEYTDAATTQPPAEIPPTASLESKVPRNDAVA